MSWRDEAACVGKPVEWWFPRSGGVDAYRKGIEVCAGCPSRVDCRADHARAERELGMALPGLWGGEIQGRASRLTIRQATVRECVVCGKAVRDRGTGIIPRFCGYACLNRAAYRRRVGAPESDAGFAEWRRANPQGGREKVAG